MFIRFIFLRFSAFRSSARFVCATPDQTVRAVPERSPEPGWDRLEVEGSWSITPEMASQPKPRVEVAAR